MPVWSDEFEADGLPDGGKWAYDTFRNPWGWFNNELQYDAAARLQNSSIADGVLSITAIKEQLTSAPDCGGPNDTSARLITQGKYEFRYGFVEVRAKTPCSLGTWPAIWTPGIPADNWPFGVPQYLLLNLAIGGDLGGPVPAGFTTDRLQVDCVRVYRP